MVDEQHLPPLGVRCLGDEYATCVFRLQMDGSTKFGLFRPAKDERDGGEPLRRVGLTDRHVVAAVVVQVSDGDVASEIGVQRRAAVIGQPVLVAPEDPRPLPLAARLAAGHREILAAIAVDVARRRRRRLAAFQFDRLAERAVVGHGSQTHAIGPRQEQMRPTIERHDPGQGVRRRHGLRVTRPCVRTRLLHGRGRRHTTARRIESLLRAAPIDRRVALDPAGNQIGKTVGVNVAGGDLIAGNGDRRKPLGLEPQFRLAEQPQTVGEQEGQILAAIAVEIARRDRRATGGRQQDLPPLAQPVGPAKVHKPIEVRANAIAQNTDRKVVVAVAVQIAHGAGHGSV